ncbi:MAG: Rieske 2Fe-2S domain-containing protein [Bradymonadia bacterium]
MTARAQAYRYPFPPFPDGWFQVGYSQELAPGAVVPLKYFGRDLVMYRGEGGAVHVLDAHCPHLGAHLGHGGRVAGDEIECPFHAWRFTGDGKCAHIPYAGKIPPKANLAPWHVREVNGLIMVWHHGAGGPPTWEVPVVTEHGDEAWTKYETRRWRIRTHNQEMAENSVDSAHFLYLHKTQDQPVSHAETKGHLFEVHSTTKQKAFGTILEGQIHVQCFGFGFTLTRFTGIVETLLISSVTAIDDEYVDTRFTFTVRKGPNDDVTNVVGERYVAEIERQVGADIPIWENKAYVNPPLLCDGDGPIGPYRKWARQFYSMPWPPA